MNSDSQLHYHIMPDPLEEFLSQILDEPNLTPTPTPTPMYPGMSAPVSAPPPISFPISADESHPTCRWVSQSNPSVVCGASLSPDPREACAHFRRVHRIRGNDKAIVSCRWHVCGAPPMQRGSVIRHILAVHLGLLRWQCEGCGRVFSRKGTGHVCCGGTDA